LSFRIGRHSTSCLEGFSGVVYYAVQGDSNFIESANEILKYDPSNESSFFSFFRILEFKLMFEMSSALILISTRF